MLVRVVIWHLADVEALLGISLDKGRGHAGMIVHPHAAGAAMRDFIIIATLCLGGLGHRPPMVGRQVFRPCHAGVVDGFQCDEEPLGRLGWRPLSFETLRMPAGT
jgi:hypothetical protein